MLKFNFPNN